MGIITNMPTLTARPVNAGTNRIAPGQAALVNAQTLTDITNRGDVNPGVVVLTDPGQVITALPIPPKITFTIVNNVASDSLLDIQIFNNNALEPVPGSVVVTCSDGFGGKFIDNLVAGLGKEGLMIFGFNITGYDKDGVKSDVTVNESNLTQLFYTGNGKSPVPFTINVSGSERNTQFKDGLFTVKVPFIVNVLSQFKMSLGGNGAKIQLVFFTQPIKD
jgi:hypothetical protein